MTTTPRFAAPVKRPLGTPSRARGVAGSHNGLGRRVGKLATLSFFPILLAFNVWWYSRDTRQIADLGTIERWMRDEQYAQAHSALRERLRRSPWDAEARMMLARAMAARKDLLGCARQLHEVPFWSPHKAEALYREGQSYLMIDRAGDAESAWLGAIKDDPLHPPPPDVFHDACQELLKLYAIEDRWEDAYPVLWSAYDNAAPMDRPFFLTMRMRAELERVAPKESIETLRRYAKTVGDWEALRALARAELALGLRAEAASHFQACLKVQPDNVRAWRDYLSMLFEEGDLDGFLAVLEKAPKAAERAPEAWGFRGIAREIAEDWKAAADCFRAAIELNPYEPKYHYRLAMAAERLGQREQAAVHRRRTKVINEARAQLPAAYADYFAASAPEKPTIADIATACKHLAKICETMGWSRAAQAWSRRAGAP
jgi:tetratricopeptide (TPR) repeat protein